MRNTLLAGIAAVALAGLGPAANAGLLAQFSTDGGATFTTLCSGASGTSCSTSTNVPGGLDYTIFGASSNSPGTPSLADLLSATVELTNPETTNQSVLIRIGDTGFTMPAVPPTATFSNSLSTTIVVGGGANLINAFACVNGTDAQNTCPGTIELGTISNDITGDVTHDSAGNSIGVASLTSPYSMTEVLQLTLAPGGNFNFVTSAQLASVPEPSTILAFAGLGLIGLGAYSRRKKQPHRHGFGGSFA